MNKFIIHNIRSNSDDLEQLGTKEKFWFIFTEKNDEKWLFKYSRKNTGEHWSEKVAEQICEVLGIPHVEYQLAMCNERFGVISKNVVQENFSLVMGNEVLNSFDPEHYPEPYQGGRAFVHVREHTLTRLNQCFLQMNVLPPAGVVGLDAMDVFCGYLMLDVLIGNQDRHHENWGILIDDVSGKRFLCPTYDHAASLGRELLDSDRERKLKSNDRNQQIPGFVARARSEFFASESHGKPMLTIEAFSSAVENRKMARDYWLSSLDKLSRDIIFEIFEQIPEVCISGLAKEFAIQMILENKRRLLSYEE